MSYARKLENVTITSKSSFIESKSMARTLTLFDSIHTPFYLVRNNAAIDLFAVQGQVHEYDVTRHRASRSDDDGFEMAGWESISRGILRKTQ